MQYIKRITQVLTMMCFMPVTMAASLTVEKAWATPTFAMAKMGAVYGVLANQSDSAIEITGLSVSQDIALSAELHESYMNNDMASMRQLDWPYTVPAGENLELAPRAKHIMLIGLKKPLEKGMTFDVILQIKGSDDIPMQVTVAESEHHERQPVHKHHH